jgi:phosphoribosylaminoimidazole carboxylase PurE protein
MANPVVGIIMGSKSDWPTMKEAAEVLTQFGIEHEVEVISAHRTPDRMSGFAKSARKSGLKVIIAGAGGAAHLPGMVASMTTLPVIGVPIQSKALSGVDSLHSIVQMPTGIPVATVAIGGGANAGLLAVQILGAFDTEIASKLEEYRKQLEFKVKQMNDEVQEELGE